MNADDIFHYVCGLLHSPKCPSRFAAELGKMIPRIPMVEGFWEFAAAGQRFAKLHVGYERVDPWRLDGVPGRDASPSELRVEQFAFAGQRSERDRSTIVVNEHVTLSGIAQEAQRYEVKRRSALEWLIERYRVRIDKNSGIASDPNAWGEEDGDPRYIVDLIARIVRVSLESVEVVESLPPLGI